MVEQKNRHGCLAAWLVLIIILNSTFALIILLASIDVLGKYKLASGIPDLVFAVMIGCALFNLVCAMVLFKWKKWGFWGYLASNIVTIFVSIPFRINTGQLFLVSLIGVGLLYGVLHIGKENKGWSQLD
ncbi:MAG TPA: hypothetical protein ENH23_01980 [candidate division Zixibacteria bacterium]|nr:hypothetical protein [candidate division Zixibacteria bacterium]